VEGSVDGSDGYEPDERELLELELDELELDGEES
jgi:hypothetical protein